MKTPVLDNLMQLKEAKKVSYDALEKMTGISAATLNRWFRGQGAPDIDQLEIVVEALGGHMDSIFVAVGKQEMIATQNIEYQGASAMIEHYEARLASLREQVSMLQSYHEKALQNRDETYDRSVTYLKSQVHEMRIERAELYKELDDQKRRADHLDNKRHNVFWGMLAIVILLLILMAVMIIVDAPGIGMGWE